MLYETLAQTHPTYDAALLMELRDLYVGGYEIQERASTYLPQLVGENDTRWTERQGTAAFIGYLANVVDHFASALFSQPIHVRPAEGSGPVDEDFYESFHNDADLASSSFQEVCRSVLTWALIHKRGLLAVDFPNVDAPVATRRDEDALGLSRAYVYQVPTEQLIDWEYETQAKRRERTESGAVEFDVGWFKWAVLYRQQLERDDPSAKRDTLVEQWKIWKHDDQGRVVWELYEHRSKVGDPNARRFTPTIASDTTGSQYHAGTALEDSATAGGDVPMVASGVTSFLRIPLVEVSVPDGLWMGNKIGPLNKEHWQRRSIVNASENRALVAVPYVLLGPEAGAGGSAVTPFAQRDPERGLTLGDQLSARGYLVLGHQDKPGYMEPTGGYQDSAEERIGKLVDEIYRVSHLMASSVSSTSKATGRSGTSKAEDRFATTVVLQALGAIVRDFARRTYEVISEARAEPSTWQATGADRFDLFDREQVIAEAVEVANIAIPSKTFAVEYKSQLAQRLVTNLAPEVQETIREEIEAGVDDERKQAEESRKALAAAAIAPAQGVVAREGDQIVTPQGRGPLRVNSGAKPPEERT